MSDPVRDDAGANLATHLAQGWVQRSLKRAYQNWDQPSAKHYHAATSWVLDWAHFQSTLLATASDTRKECSGATQLATMTEPNSANHFA